MSTSFESGRLKHVPSNWASFSLSGLHYNWPLICGTRIGESIVHPDTNWLKLTEDSWVMKEDEEKEDLEMDECSRIDKQTNSPEKFSSLSKRICLMTRFHVIPLLAHLDHSLSRFLSDQWYIAYPYGANSIEIIRLYHIFGTHDYLHFPASKNIQYSCFARQK